MKRLPLFGHQRFFIVSEEAPEHEAIWFTEWPSEIVLESEWESWLDTVKANTDPEEFKNLKLKKELHSIPNREYEAKYIIGQVFDDFPTMITEKECPECEHLLVAADPEEHDGLFCSNHQCTYQNDEMKKALEELTGKPEGRTLYLESVDPIEFAKEVGISLDESDSLNQCYKCKTKMGSLRAFRSSSGYAGVSADCPNCKNHSSTFVPVTKEAIEKWSFLL